MEESSGRGEGRLWGLPEEAIAADPSEERFDGALHYIALCERWPDPERSGWWDSEDDLAAPDLHANDIALGRPVQNGEALAHERRRAPTGQQSRSVRALLHS